MSIDGIAGISHRIAAIQATIGSLSPTPAVPAATGGEAAFAGKLAEAVQGFGTTAPEAAPATTGARNADGVPVELAAYGNGKIPAAALAPVEGTSHRLWAPAAEALDRLRADAKRDGVTIGITDSYRSYEAQVDVAARKGLYKNGGLAAVPGTSDHGWGMAVDLALDDRAQAWMRANGERYGFVEDTPREPWHWGFKG
jgi:hypothetical protein